MSGRHMDQVAAFDDTIELARERGMADVAAADWSLAFDHLTDMQENVRSGNLSPSKCGRWLGWAQAAVVAAGLATLQEMGEINRRHADRPDETPPIVGLEQVDACCATAIEGLVTLEDFAAELGVDLDEPKVEHDEMLALAAGYMSADIEALREIHPEVVLASLSAAMKAAGYVKAHVHFEVRGTRCFPGDGGSEPECLLRFSTAENAITHAVARHAAPEHARIAKVSGSTVDVDARPVATRCVREADRRRRRVSASSVRGRERSRRCCREGDARSQVQAGRQDRGREVALPPRDARPADQAGPTARRRARRPADDARLPRRARDRDSRPRSDRDARRPRGAELQREAASCLN